MILNKEDLIARIAAMPNSEFETLKNLLNGDQPRPYVFGNVSVAQQDLIARIAAMPDSEFETLKNLLNGDQPRPCVFGNVNVAQQALYNDITSTLVSLGFAAHQNGYDYIRSALMIMIAEPDLFNKKITVLYSVVGKRHDTTGSRTERSIRHAISSAFDKHAELFAKAFPACTEVPTNSEFLYTLADRFKSGTKIL